MISGCSGRRSETGGSPSLANSGFSVKVSVAPAVDASSISACPLYWLTRACGSAEVGQAAAQAAVAEKGATRTRASAAARRVLSLKNRVMILSPRSSDVGSLTLHLGIG